MRSCCEKTVTSTGDHVGIPDDIEQFEKSLKELTIKYEQYFLGLEKREPTRLREEVERLARKHTTASISNTMLQFRYNSLKSRLSSYRQYWNRTNRLIEEGTYSRDRFKMEIHGRKPSPVADAPAAPPEDDIFRQYLEACKTCNLPIDGITRESVAASLDKFRSGLSDRYKTDRIEFRVQIEGGKPRIKARPK